MNTRRPSPPRVRKPPTWPCLSLPYFLAKLGVAPLSGVLLAGFARPPGPRHSGTLWLIIGLTTMIAPVGLFVFQRFIRVHEAGRDD